MRPISRSRRLCDEASLRPYGPLGRVGAYRAGQSWHPSDRPPLSQPIFGVPMCPMEAEGGIARCGGHLNDLPFAPWLPELPSPPHRPRAARAKGAGRTLTRHDAGSTGGMAQRNAEHRACSPALTAFQQPTCHGTVPSFGRARVRRRRRGRPILRCSDYLFLWRLFTSRVAYPGSMVASPESCGGVPTRGTLVTGRSQGPGRPSSWVVPYYSRSFPWLAAPLRVFKAAQSAGVPRPRGPIDTAEGQCRRPDCGRHSSRGKRSPAGCDGGLQR
jgi:hypothetical protein